MLSRDIIVSVTASVVAFPKSTVEEVSPVAQEDVRDWRRGKVANPMTKYPEFRDSRPSATGRDSGRTIVVQVESASGAIGIGITNGGVASAAIVELHLADIVEGQPAFAHETISDRMINSTLQYGRKGVVLHAISAVDLAIWDLHGRLVGQPVYQLLGGPTSVDLPMYGTGPLAGPMRSSASTAPSCRSPTARARARRASVATSRGRSARARPCRTSSRSTSTAGCR